MRIRDLFSGDKASREDRRHAFDTAGVCLLLLYLLVGVIYSALISPVSRFPDEIEYLKLSHNLVAGPGYSMDGVHLTASRPPGYPFFLAAIRFVGGDVFSFRVVQFLLLAATLFLTYRLCSERKIFAGLLIVTGLAALYPVLFYTSGTLYPQTLSAFLFILVLNLALIDPRGLVINIFTGLVFGVLILEVPTFLLTMFVALGAFWFYKLLRARDALIIVLAASLVVGTWSTRNAIVFHRFIPLTTNSGLNFLEGNNPDASPYEAAANKGMETYYDQAEKLGLDEFQSDRFYRDAALAWIEANPGRALVLYLDKVLNFFNIVNVYSSQIQSTVSPWKQAVLAVGYLILVGLLFARLMERRRFPLIPREKAFLMIYVLSAFTSAIFFTRIRHRLPFDFLIIAVVGLYLSRRLEAWMEAKPLATDPAR
jgi:hypothetical protein